MANTTTHKTAKAVKPTKQKLSKEAAAFQEMVRSYDELAQAFDKLSEEHEYFGERYIGMKDENARLHNQVEDRKSVV